MPGVTIKPHSNAEEKNKYLALSFAIAFGYFTFGAITNVAGAIIPKISETYNVSPSLSVVLAAVFFIAYGFTSLPWGLVITAAGKKKTLIYSTLVTILGVLLFANISGFIINMISMFICGIGVTGIQVVLNPLVNDISSPEKYSRNLTIFMVLMGAGSYCAPQLVTLIKNLNLPWTFSYWVFSVLAVIMLVLISLQKFPAAAQEERSLDDTVAERTSSRLRRTNDRSVLQVHEDHEDDENAEIGVRKQYPDEVNLINEATAFVTHHEDLPVAKSNPVLELLTQQPLIYLYALGIFLYVGVEVGLANTLSFYLEDKYKITETLGVTAEALKNTTISNYWGALLLGRLLSSLYLDKISSRLAIQIHAVLACIALFFAISSNDLNVALWALPAVAFSISIMFPSIYGLTTKSFAPKYADAISSILCTAIIGGAFIGPLIAKVAELAQGSLEVPNWSVGFIVAFACYAYLFVVSLLPKQIK
ncbi:MAG: MFS transporter [Vampirovibrionia bacterium]|jgi:fucose permease